MAFIAAIPEVLGAAEAGAAGGAVLGEGAAAGAEGAEAAEGGIPKNLSLPQFGGNTQQARGVDLGKPGSALSWLVTGTASAPGPANENYTDPGHTS